MDLRGAASLVLLGAAIAVLLLGRGRLAPARALPVLVVAGLLTGVVEPGSVGPAARPLAGPLAFLVLAVPLAVLLDRLGSFDAAASRVVAGHRLRRSLWVFAALVTTVFNLDAAIVLLTPLYLRIARRHGVDPLTTALQPVLLASLASSALPVSNLTNLIVAEHLDLGARDFALQLGPASLAATAAGWFAYRRLALSGGARPTVVPTGEVAPTDRRALWIGGVAAGVLLAGFTVGDAAGLPAWAVAGAVTAGLCVVARDVPWRTVPVGPAAVALCLAVLVGAASSTFDPAPLVQGDGPVAELRAVAAGAVAADAVNNLPALLAALPDLEGDGSTWAYLLGVNVGPVFWLSGSLAGLLWLDILRRFGLHLTPGGYARMVWPIGPAAVVAAVVARLATAAAGW